MKEITTEELLDLPRQQFIDRNKQWIKEMNNGEFMECGSLECPLHLWVVHNRAKCRQEMVGNTALCELCGHPMCPDCMNHRVSQLSRVTGYLATVENWGAAKQQEFKDRQRHNIG